MRLCWSRLWLALVFVFIAPGLHADNWPGFLGAQRQGCSATPTVPLHWSPTEHIRWRTPLPGEGHSSPIVVGDAIYLSLAEEKPQPAHLLTAVRLGLLVLAWGVLAAALWAVAARSREGLGARGLVTLAVMLALALVMALLVIYGENALTFDRALERGWATAVLSLVLALALISAAGGTRTPTAPGRSSPLRSLLAAGGLVVVAGVAYLAIPDRAHAFDHGPLHPKSLFLSSVVVLPLFAGLMLGALTLRRLRPGLALSLGAPGLLLMATGAVVLAMAVLRAQHNTRGVVSVSTPYAPHLKWWLPVGLLGLVVIVQLLRRRWPRALILNLTGVLALAGTIIVGLGFGLEVLITCTPYLAYIVGQPYYHPIIAPWIALAFAGATILALAVAVVAVRLRQHAPAASFGAVPALLTVLLGCGCFAYVLYVPRDRMFQRGLICLDRASGAVRWRTPGLLAPKEMMHNDNSAATPTPVSDGERVYAYFGSPGLMATDRQGRLLWTYSQLPFVSTEGVAASPIVHGTDVIVLSESQAGQWLVALDGPTGHVRWRTQRTQKMHLYAGNCRTPLLWPVQGQPTLIVWGLEDLSGYDPETGRELWTHEITGFGSSTNPVACPVADDERVYLLGPTQSVAVAIDRLTQRGSPIVWNTPCTDGAQCASPVLSHGLLLAVSDTGTGYCVDARSGEMLWTHDFAWQSYASPIAVGDRIYFTDTRGKTHVIAAERQYRLLATNDLGEPVSASLAPVNGRLYVRTGKGLLCLAE